MKNNIYILIFIQALLSLLLLFTDKTIMYTALLVFLIIDLVVFISLLRVKWSSIEMYVFTTLFVSILYLFFLFFVKGQLLIVIGIGVMLLFIISGVLSYEKKVIRYLPMPSKPSKVDVYDIEDVEHDIDDLEKKEALKKKEQAKIRGMEIAKELEREVSEIKKAETYIRKKDTSLVENELVKEALDLEKASKQAALIERAMRESELTRQARTLESAQKDINKVELSRQAKELVSAQNRINKLEISKQAKELESAEKKIREVQLLNKQKELTKQVTDLAKAQIKIDSMKKKISKPKKIASVISKDNLVFATKTGNNYHETGCMIIKKIPKKNLILFNNPKEAMKKGYKPCNVCKP